MDTTAIYDAAFARFGADMHLLVLIEKANELSIRSSRFLKKRSNIRWMISAMADLDILMAQFLHQGYQAEFEAEKHKKLTRLSQRLQIGTAPVVMPDIVVNDMLMHHANEHIEFAIHYAKQGNATALRNTVARLRLATKCLNFATQYYLQQAQRQAQQSQSKGNIR